VVVPVSDADRAKRFYASLGWREDIDIAGPQGYRAVHFTPRGSSVSILPDPERRSYASYASFSDPDGNSWLLQELTERLPGRV
jgi:catechol 2,3-dioxygenase-like lactoylglutathione lyase family enzyme